MKRFACLLALATFAAVAPGYGQSATDQVVEQMSGIHRPTPKPGASPGATSTSVATGPLSAALAKDAKGKSTTSTFAPGDTVYLICTNVTAAKGDKIGVAWYGGKKERKVYGSESAAPNAGVFNPSFNLPPPKGGSPAGTYRVELLVNSKAVKSLKFTVQ